MELTKSQKREVKALIKIGINRGCQKWLDETVRIIQEPYVEGEENPWDRSLVITKRSRNYFKDTMRREDNFYRDSWLLFSVATLINEDNLQYEEVEPLGEEILAAVHLIADKFCPIKPGV